MTRAAAAARVAGASDVGDRSETTRSDLVFDRAFGNKEARADKSFIADPLVAGGVAVLANRGQQRVARELRAVLSTWFEFGKVSLQCVPILSDDGGLGSRDIHNAFSQQ